MAREWPLIGRADELRTLQVLVERDDVHGAVLVGPAGVGKTRLGLELLRWAEAQGYATARVTGTRSAAGLPFGAMAPLLPRRPEDLHGVVDNRVELLRWSASAFVAQAREGRLVVLIDDAHLLDDASATLVHQLASERGAFVLATVRSGELAPDPVIALWKDGLAQRVELKGLHAEALGSVLVEAVGGQVAPGTARAFAERCQGNVLFLRELVLGALEDGSLREDDGVWSLAGRLALSDRLVELVESRLAGLGDSQRELLEVIALGEPLGSAELSSFGGAPTAEVLERKGLLTSSLDRRRLEVRIAHPLYADAVRARLPVLRERDITRRLAEIVEGTGARRREDVLRIATWRLQAGGGSADLMFAAARTARWRYDLNLAHRLAVAAVDAGAGFDAVLLAEEIRSLQGHGEAAEAALAGLADRAADDAQRGAVALARFDNLVFRMGRLDEGNVVALAAEAAISDVWWRDEVTARRAGLLFVTEGPRAAAQLAEPLLSRATGGTLVNACFASAWSFGRMGRLADALAVCDVGRAAHASVTTPLPWYGEYHDFVRCWMLVYLGRLDEAERLATRGYEQAVVDHAGDNEAHFAFALGLVAAQRGHVHTASRHLRDAISRFRELRYWLLMWRAMAYLTLVLAAAGQGPEAADALYAVEHFELSPKFHLAVELGRARAWLAADEGNLPRARSLLREAAAVGEDIGDNVGAAVALHDLARLDAAGEAVERLRRVAENVEGDLTATRLAHTEALARNDVGGLEAASVAFEAIGADLLAAEASAAAATIAADRGDARAAAALRRRAIDLGDRCEGATTPALQRVDTRIRLTPAERETALLAARGRANKEIAEEQHLSVRTVENRLQHVYEKLGIAGRSELAAALGLSATG